MRNKINELLRQTIKYGSRRANKGTECDTENFIWAQLGCTKLNFLTIIPGYGYPGIRLRAGRSLPGRPGATKPESPATGGLFKQLKPGF